MKEYLLSVVGIVLFSSILLSIAPNGKMGELIKSIARMACILCILSPFLGLFAKNTNLTSFFTESGIELQSDFIQYSNEARIAETEKILKEELQQIVSKISRIEIAWSVQPLDNGSFYVETLQVDLINVWTKEVLRSVEEASILDYLKTEYGCEDVCISVADYE